MKRMIFIAPGKLDWEEIAAPKITDPAQAIVKPVVMGRCDLDRLYLSGRMPMAKGEPIGHEIIGDIIQLGDDASTHLSVGQRVIVPAQISCGTCRMCCAGDTGRCEAVPLGASYGMGRAGDYGGGVSEQVLVPFAEGMLVPIPGNIDPVPLMGMADMATDAWRAVGPQLAKRPGGTVLVIGGAVPVIGIYAAAMALNLGASRSVYVDANIENRAMAESYGAEVVDTIDAVADPIFDIVVDAASDQKALLHAIRACGPAAQLTSVAPPLTSPELPLMEIYYKGLDWHIGRPNCRGSHGPTLHAWAACGFRPEKIGPKLFAFDEAIEAWLDPSLYVAVQNF